ncbi:MurR/RpiR family transcriptional regulator [Romboutsia sp.]|uniref:MurR/RpiR family transcriptional regulator n=1 Tax=Romboutsia sp. TaxID=1965302 RepID=UPI003F3F9656
MVFEYLSAKYNLSTVEQSIIKYLYRNIDDLKKIGIRRVAQDNFTSTTTIYKLCKKLNFEGYSDMIYHICYSSRENEVEPTVDVYTNASKQVNANLESFSELLNKSKSKLIMLLSVGISQTIANYINERLAINGFRCISNTHLQLLTPESKDDVLLVVISNSGETKSLLELTTKAYNSGIEIISFCSNENSAISKISSLPIIIQGRDSFSFLQNPPDTFYSELLLIFECFMSNLNSVVHVD